MIKIESQKRFTGINYDELMTHPNKEKEVHENSSTYSSSQLCLMAYYKDKDLPIFIMLSFSGSKKIQS